MNSVDPNGITALDDESNRSNAVDTDLIRQHLLACQPRGGVIYVGAKDHAEPFVMPDGLDDAVAFAERIGTDVYFTPGCFKSVDGTLERDLDHAVGASAASCDVDDWTDKSDAGLALLRSEFGDALSMLDSRPGADPPRRQVFVRLDDHVMPDELRQLNLGLVELLGGDDNPVHAASWMRLAGTRNSKAQFITTSSTTAEFEPDGAATAWVIEPTPGAAASPPVLRAFLPAYVSKPKAKIERLPTSLRPGQRIVVGEGCNGYLMSEFGKLRNKKWSAEHEFVEACMALGLRDTEAPEHEIRKRAEKVWTYKGSELTDDEQALLTRWEVEMLAPEAQVPFEMISDSEIVRLHREQENANALDDDDEMVSTGGAFLFDDEDAVAIRWGRGDQVLWPAGESLIVAGGIGAGKTSIAGQLVRSLIGITDSVLDFPVEPARKVLYLAMDRPKQIRRALRRQLRPADRAVIDERLVVRKGPLPQDLVKDPSVLLRLAQKHGCDVVVVDSLKDAAIKLSDDETGNSINRAVQLCNANGVDVLMLHHHRKQAQGGAAPKSLADIYGSTWITAGAGSVVFLHGEAGDEHVELLHLKPPMEPVGPLRLVHDHAAGTTAVVVGFDLWGYLRGRGAEGATAAEALRAEHGVDVPAANSAAAKKTERVLKKFVRDRVARRDEPGRDAEGRVVAARYYAVDISVDTGTSAPAVDTPVDTRRHEEGNPR